MDTKKKELVGDFKSSGREWHPKGPPETVRVHPSGARSGQSAVCMIRRWWQAMGQPLYPRAQRLLLTADGGGSNGSRNWLWKREFQALADATGLAIEVTHLPRGTSKWNTIEHRLFSFISQNWRGKPLVSHEIIVQLIAATTNRKGLAVRAEIDRTSYSPGHEGQQ